MMSACLFLESLFMPIKLNADIGESFGSYSIGNDAIMSYIDQANIACGFHAGDPYIMHKTVLSAQENNVAIGAHVGYRDLAGFGRRFINYEPHILKAEIQYQLGALSAFADIEYVKPHGALYNYASHNKDQAMPIIEAILDFDPRLTLMGLAYSPILDWAQEAGLSTFAEAFADRAYESDMTLRSRSLPGAVLSHDEAVAQAIRFAQEGWADSICVHGDSPDAFETAIAIRKALHAH